MKKILTFLAVVMMASACVSESTKESGDFFIRFYKDPETNVQYILYYSGEGASITPRLNADGTIYVSKTTEVKDNENRID